MRLLLRENLTFFQICAIIIIVKGNKCYLYMEGEKGCPR